MKRFCWLFLLFIIPNLIHAQAKRALNLIEKLKYDQAEELLLKSINNDSISAGEKYVYSILLFTEDYYHTDIDSAYYYSLSAIEDFKKSDVKTLEKLEKDEITMDSLTSHKNRIEHFTYETVRKENTEEAYQDYLDKYSASLLTDSVIHYRNKTAFDNVSEINNWESYEKFMQKYPESDQYSEAKTRYEELIYNYKTRDGKLASYEAFLLDFPETPFREEIEESIFKISTGSHATEDYLAFINKHPGSQLVKLSASRIYHIARTNNNMDSYSGIVYKYLDKDSLENLENLEKSFLFPIKEDVEYKLMKENGDQLFDNGFNNIPEEYKCGNITESVLLAFEEDNTSRILNRAGTQIYADTDINGIKDLGYGYVLFTKGKKSGIVSMTGEIILPATAEEVRILQGQYIAYRENDLWGITCVNGIDLLEPQYFNIDEYSSLIQVFDQPEQFTLINPETLDPLIDKEQVNFNFQYDDAEILPNDLFLTYSGDKQGILTKDLKMAVPEEEQELIQIDKGLLIESKDGFRFISTKIDINPSIVWDDMDFNSGWISLKGKNGWVLVSLLEEKILDEYIDSIRLLNQHLAIANKSGIRSIYFKNGSNINLRKESNLEIISSPPAEDTPQSFYALIKGKNSKWLLDANGDTLLVDYFTEARAFGEEYLVVSGRNGSGLFDSKGNLLLKPEYDGIANYKDGGVTILNNGKLGFYRLSDKTFIPPIYLKSIRSYNKFLFIAYLDKGYGLISNKDESVLDFEFDDIDYFNDSLAWVKREGFWHLLDFRNSSYLQENVTGYSSPQNTSEDYLYFQTSEGKGVLNRKIGTVISATFKDIINVGSTDSPVFMAIKYIEEADYYIVVYYDNKGNMFYRQAYPAEFYINLTCEK
ncbi:MAG: WG repeat-containing protein [Saprospiraceae bacterium]|nr:WG repeat-containing protein [Saprospiraceae bacterium]